MADRVKIGLVGMGFGASFAPILRDHPNSDAVCVIALRDNPAVPGELRRLRVQAIPDYSHYLPAEIRKYCSTKLTGKDHVSFAQGGGHGGSYPHMVHEFVSAIRERRRSAIDAETAANWTMAGICAHESAMNGGERVAVPTQYT